MLAAKTLAGVTPEVNLRNPLQADDKAHVNEGIILALKPRADITRSPKATKKTYVLKRKKNPGSPIRYIFTGREICNRWVKKFFRVHIIARCSRVALIYHSQSAYIKQISYPILR